MSYSNFKDPVGLFRRMLASGNRAAYFTLVREGLGVALTPVDVLLSWLEKRRIRKAPPSELPLILILGGSRSGTTLLYQTLAQYLPVSYFNNLSVSFSRSPITAGKWFNRFQRKKKGNFDNYYGSVAGFNSPNDGFHIWNRWLGEDRNAVPKDIGVEKTEDMKRFFDAWFAAFGKPLLNKNNRNSLCVKLFTETFANVYFVEIRRDPIYVAQSLIQSREAVQGSKYVPWGLGSENPGRSADPLSYVDDICRQVYRVEQELNQGRALVDPERYIQVRYETFCEEPRSVVQELSQTIWGRDLAESDLSGLAAFKATNEQKVSDEEFCRIKTTIAGLFGDAEEN